MQKDNTYNKKRQDNNDDPFEVSSANEYPRIKLTTYPSWLSKIDRNSVEFLEMISHCDANKLKHGLTLDDKILHFLKQLDPLVINWGLKRHCFYMYSLASSSYRSSFSKPIATSINGFDKDIFDEPIRLPIDWSKEELARIWSIKSLSLRLVDLVGNYSSEDGCGLKVIANLPIRLKCNTVESKFKTDKDDEVMDAESNEIKKGEWNKFEIFNGAIGTDGGVEIKLEDNEALSMINPFVNDLNEITFELVPFGGGFSFNSVELEIECFDKKLLDKVKQNGGILPASCQSYNMPLIKFILGKPNLFDVNMTNFEDGNNALHAICVKKDLPLALFELLIESGINLSLKNRLGYTPIDLLYDLNVAHNNRSRKQEIVTFLERNGALYNMTDPTKQSGFDKQFFETFVYQHDYISKHNYLQANMDAMIHKLGM